MTKSTTELKRDLLDDDGENRAVRSFLGMYQCGGNPSVKMMKIHLEHSGFNGCWPDWVNDPANAGHLTKGGAQDWIRYLLSLEGRSAAHGEQSDYAALEREHLGDPDKRTGIYHPDVIAPSQACSAEQSEREAFEKHFGPKDGFAWRNEDGSYKVASLQTAWEVWQARAALASAPAKEVPEGWITREEAFRMATSGLPTADLIKQAFAMGEAFRLDQLSADNLMKIAQSENVTAMRNALANVSRAIKAAAPSTEKKE